jgi:hypothetical protein
MRAGCTRPARASRTTTQVVETMFGDATYTISFEDGQEVGVAADQLDPADDESGDAADE